jgi:hypothetical protein
MDTEAPVFRVPMNFVCLTRETDTVDKTKKKNISRQASVLNETNPKISTKTHPLRKYPMYLGGSADAEWCDKHAMAVAVKMTTNPMKAFFREEMRIIRLLRNTHIWIALSTQASAILEAKGCRELDDIDQELIAAIGPERLEEMKRNNPAGLKLPVISEPACAYVYVFQNECLNCMYVGVLYIHIQKVHMCAYFYPHVHMSVCVCIVCMCMYLKILFLQIHTDIYRYIQYIQYMHIHAKSRYIHIHSHMDICMYMIVS